MKTLAEHFCLKNDLANFFINGSDFKVLGSPRVTRALNKILRDAAKAKRAPRLAIVGDYGSGKTHHLHHIRTSITKHHLPFKPVYTACPFVSSRSPFSILFECLLSKLGFDYFRPLLVAAVGRDPHSLRAIPNRDLRTAFSHIAFTTTEAELAWAFLSGNKLSKSDQVALGISSNQISRCIDFSAVMQYIAQVIYEQTKTMLVYLIDECDNVEAITDKKASEAWLSCLKGLLNNHRVGFALAISAQSLQEFPALWCAPSIASRIGQSNFLVLECYTPDEIEVFLKGLFKTSIDPKQRAVLERKAKLCELKTYKAATYPFTEGALRAYCVHLASDASQAKPSAILNRLHETLASALAAGKLVIDEEFLQRLNSSHQAPTDPRSN